MIRLYTQNINGIPLKDIEDEFHHMLSMMVMRDINVIGWSETNIEWYDSQIYQKLYKVMKQHYKGGSWKPCTSGIPMHSNYKPGGNIMILNKRMKSRTITVSKDEMGRWVWTVIQGNQKEIAIIQVQIVVIQE